MSRAFVAIVPPRDVLDAVGKVSWNARHRPQELALPRLLGPRWSTREKWHVTLQFLGTRVDLDAAANALACVSAAPARVRLGGVGGFPHARRANVLWVGAIEGASALDSIATAVRDAMGAVASEPDEHGFHPHLTLARLARAADLRATVERTARTRIGPSWTADRVVLFESVTASSGAQYREHASVTLREQA